MPYRNTSARRAFRVPSALFWHLLGLLLALIVATLAAMTGSGVVLA